MRPLEKRFIDICYRKNLSHIGSGLTALPILEEIYDLKRPDEPFVLSNGHAGLALYCVLEKYGYGDAEELFDKHGVHPNLDPEHGIFCSTGSLGHGIGIAVGLAVADRRNVYCLISDGESNEGSVWESLRIASELKLTNLKVFVNANGYGANEAIDIRKLENRLREFFPCEVRKTNLFGWPDYLQGLQAHYHQLKKEEYETLICQDAPRIHEAISYLPVDRGLGIWNVG